VASGEDNGKRGSARGETRRHENDLQPGAGFKPRKTGVYSRPGCAGT
jgi:hypothetical protein